VKLLAFRRQLFDRASAGEIAVIEKWEFPQAKTKAANQLIGRVAPDGKVLIVDAPFAPEAQRAIRNLERVSCQEAAKLNVVDLAQYRKIVVSSKAIEVILARANGGNN